MSNVARKPAASEEAHESHDANSNSRGQRDRPADSAQSLAEVDKDATVVPKQTMAVGLDARGNIGADAQEGDVPMPWWYTPRRLLVRNCRKSQF